MKFTKALLIASISATTQLSTAVELEQNNTYAALPRLCVNPDTVTISGFSAGGSFAHNLSVIHSKTIKGAGILHGGPYIDKSLYEGNLSLVDLPKEKIAKIAVDNAKTNSNAEKIDDVSNLANNAAYIVGGTNDTTVPIVAQEAIGKTLIDLGMPKDQIKGVRTNRGHSHADYEPAKAVRWLMLKLGFISEFVPYVEDPFTYGEQTQFDQLDIVDSLEIDNAIAQIEDFGNIYIPNDCLTEQCHVHFAFHGKGGLDQSVEKKAYNNIAATNKIVVVYPRSAIAYNQPGKVDEGDTDEGINVHMTKDGLYPRIIMAMLDRLKQCD